jgi:hypothetical protein
VFLQLIKDKDIKVDPWISHKFKNSARSNEGPKGCELELNHWSKASEANQEYPFAKFNKRLEIYKYTD